MSISPIKQVLPQITNKKTAIAAAALLAIAPLTMTSCNNKELSDKFIKQQNQELPSRFASEKLYSSDLTPIEKIGNANEISNFSIKLADYVNGNINFNKKDFTFNYGKSKVNGIINISNDKLSGTSEFSVNSSTDKKDYEASFYYKNNAWITKMKDKETGVENEFKFKIEKENDIAKINAYDKDDKKVFSQDLGKHKWGGPEVAIPVCIIGLIVIFFAALFDPSEYFADF